MKLLKQMKIADPQNTKKPVDPLFVIFEQHLYNFQDSDTDRKTFISNVVQDYLTFLRRKNIVIPMSLEHLVVDELGSQVNTMLVKKIYGCLSIDEFQRMVPPAKQRKARAKYSKLTTK